MKQKIEKYLNIFKKDKGKSDNIQEKWNNGFDSIVNKIKGGGYDNAVIFLNRNVVTVDKAIEKGKKYQDKFLPKADEEDIFYYDHEILDDNEKSAIRKSASYQILRICKMTEVRQMKYLEEHNCELNEDYLFESALRYKITTRYPMVSVSFDLESKSNFVTLYNVDTNKEFFEFMSGDPNSLEFIMNAMSQNPSNIYYNHYSIK